MNTLTDKIRQMKGEMTFILEKAGVNVERKLYIHELSQYQLQITAEQALTWLEMIHDGVYKVAKKARSLVSENTWDQMDMFPEDYTEFQETIIWKKAAKDLCNLVSIGNRPDFFKKTASHCLLRKFYKGHHDA